MRRLARAVLGNEHDADDAAQDAWCRVLEAPRTTERGEAWLAGVARNVARERRRTQRRRRKREERASRSETRSADQIALDQMDALHSLIQVVRSIEQPYRSALVLQYVVGLEPAQAAEALGVNRATHRSRVHRGLALMRAELHREDRTGRQRWQASIAPLITGAVPQLAGGFAVMKSTTAVGGALVLLLVGGLAYVELSSPDPEQAAPRDSLEQLSATAPDLEGVNASIGTGGEGPPRAVVAMLGNKPPRTSPPSGSPGTAPSADTQQAGDQTEAGLQPKADEEKSEPKGSKTRIWNVHHAVGILKLEPHQAEEIQRIQDEVRDEMEATLKTEPHDGRAPYELKQDALDLITASSREDRAKRTRLYSELRVVMAQRVPGTSATYEETLSQLRQDGHQRIRRLLSSEQARLWDEADTSTVFNVSQIAGGRHIKVRRPR